MQCEYDGVLDWPCPVEAVGNAGEYQWRCRVRGQMWPQVVQIPVCAQVLHAESMQQAEQVKAGAPEALSGLRLLLHCLGAPDLPPNALVIIFVKHHGLWQGSRKLVSTQALARQLQWEFAHAFISDNRSGPYQDAECSLTLRSASVRLLPVQYMQHRV